MKKINIFLISFLFVVTAKAETPTPTATPSACTLLNTCVATAVPSVVASCAGSNSSCDVTNTDKFAVTASELAERAILKKKCRNRTKKAACNACYRAAKAPLQVRFAFDIFKGLLGQAVSLIETERKATCPSLNNNN